jgi:beta-glucosidase
MCFRENFIWGAASSSYQIEGGVHEDGKGLSIWDVMCNRPDVISDGYSGNVSCDHYHRYKEDVAMMRQIGLKAYRFSISWPRILPEGVGRINPKGIAFYDRLVDELLENNILPFATLFHWDFPYELYKKGGWLSDDSSNWFADYARTVVDALSDRVKDWITINETQSFIGLGHHRGLNAPGLKLSLKEWLHVSHNVLLAHGKAAQVIRSSSKSPCKIGYAPVGVVKVPATNSSQDIAVARQATFSITEKNCENNTWWMDPIFLGKYPEDGLKLFGKNTPHFTDEDMRIISEPLDYFCINIYNGREVQAGIDGKAEKWPRPAGYWRTNYGWSVVPQALYWGPKFFYERYKKPVFITENGMANIDWKSLDGKVHDPQRINFLQRYMLQLQKAIKEGVDVRGYLHWSLTDNFEWADGFTKRFGLVYIDYRTQERILKDSAYWYSKVISSNGRILNEIPNEEMILTSDLPASEVL